MTDPTGRVAYAHSKQAAPCEQWHTLEDHLRGTADKASRFAAKFGSEKWGWYAGLWHDLGKFCAEFQQMLFASAADAEAEAPRARVNHSSAGAIRAMECFGDDGLPLSFVIAAHHAGLADFQDLRRRLAEREHLTAAELGGADAGWASPQHDLVLPSFLEGTKESPDFWIRMLFSALIDADRLDTEAFHDPSRPGERRFGSNLTVLDQQLDRSLNELQSRAEPTPVNDSRRTILDECRIGANGPQGLYTMTVPTGGGKTLASMAFALKHAIAHRLDRVIVVIPYTSIIEQNAAIYRSIFGADKVVEHHSNFDAVDEPSRLWLATENWDAPIIVTTNVQFFESIFSNRTSATRKLHNVARSVVIFDEVQTLPPSLLAPIVSALQELTTSYGSTIVLTTATQPALRARPSFPTGLKETHEIVSDVAGHFSALRRVSVQWPGDITTPVEYSELAVEISKHERVLTVVHLRNDARQLAMLVPDAVHLSALMCPVHRSEGLRSIRALLKAGDRCRVVATQLVEAGVDLDFPVVYRALAGLDSIAQAAGRCNREGRLRGEDGTPFSGVVTVFIAPTRPPVGVLRSAMEVTRTMLARHGGALNIHDPAIFEEYFALLYGTRNLDQHAIQTARAQLQFETVADRFQMIESGWQRAVIIPYDELARDAISTIRTFGPSRRLSRRLQRYSVNVAVKRVKDMLAAGIAEDLTGDETFVALRTSEFHRYYSHEFGLDLSRAFQVNPEDLIA